MVLRRLVQVKMTIDHTKIYDALQFAEGNALAGSVEIVPVRHGGENENGELKPPPSTSTFALDYLMEHGRIETKAFIPLAVKAGLTKNAAYAQIKKLTDNKAAKRIETGVYVLVERKGRAPTSAPKTKAQGTRKPQSPPGQTMVDSIVREVAAKQNGSDGGVALSDIRAAMMNLGFGGTGVGPALSNLVRKNRIVRVGEGLYRAPPDQAAVTPNRATHEEEREIFGDETPARG